MSDISLSGNNESCSDLEKKYYNFLAPAFEVYVEGNALSKTGMLISSVVVETSVEKADTFSFTVANAFDAGKGEFSWLDQYFIPGQNVKIKMGYRDNLVEVFYGLLTAVKFNFPANAPTTLVVSGMDCGFKLMTGIKSRSWSQKKHSDVVKIIAADHSITSTEVDDTGTVYQVVEQSRVTDYQLLSWMAQENNYEFFIAGKKLYFRKPLANRTPALTLVWEKNLYSFAPEIDIYGQVPQVVVRAWDEIKKEPIEANSSTVIKLGSNNTTGPDIIKKICGDNATEYVYTNVTSKSEAADRATAYLNQRSLKLITGYGESVGLPEIRAGKYIKVEGIGKKMSQLYYLTEATHCIDEKGYMTQFKVGGNAV